MNLISEKKKMPKILGVAVIDTLGRTWKLPAPSRHHHVIRLMQGAGVTAGHCPEGFYGEEGKFITRATAMIIAVASGQFNSRSDANSYQGRDLYSEDVW